METAANSAAPSIGHNLGNLGKAIEESPAIVYKEPGLLDQWRDEIEKEIAETPIDLTTKKGRDAIASLAHSISRRKTPVVAAGTALTEDWRKQTAAVNEIKRRVEADLNALRDKARAPLDAWEAAEEARRTKLNDVIAKLDGWVRLPSTTIADVDAIEAWAAGVEISEEQFGDLLQRAIAARDALTERAVAARAAILQEEAERAEFEALRREAEARRQQEEEAKRKAEAEAAEKARIEAAERRAAEEAAAAERARVQAEIDEANRKQREAERKLAEERAAKAREEEAARKAEAEAEARQRDVEHRGAIMRAAKEAVMKCGNVDEDTAKAIVLAITSGLIPNVSIRF